VDKSNLIPFSGRADPKIRSAIAPTEYPNQTTLEITGSRLRRSRTVRHLHL